MDLWRERTLAVCADNESRLLKEKTFKPKYLLPKLDCYKNDPGQAFWDKFPSNLTMRNNALIDANKLRRLATQAGYRDTNMLSLVCQDLTFGAEIGCMGVFREPSVSSNSASAVQFGEQVTDAIAAWVAKGFAYGPVLKDDIPKDAKISGLMCRPKPDGSVRVILNMSAPLGNSVNDGIDTELFPAKMSSTAKWLEVLELAGPGCQIMKIDWSDAYKHIPVCQADLKLQWFTWLDRGFAELCLVFGTASSVGIYDRAAKLVLDLVFRLSRFPKTQVCQHIDDVCAAAASGSALEEFGDTYRKVAEQVGVQLAPTDNPEKAFKPCHDGIVLGVRYNTSDWTWSIPQEKLTRLLLQIQNAMSASHLEQVEIWSLCGRILHYAPLVPSGRFNIDYLIAANSVSKVKKEMILISPELKKQLSFWHLMLRVSSGCSRIPDPTDRFPVWTRECYTDAAGGTLDSVGRGTGAVSQDWWAYVPWPRKINCGMKAADGKKLSRKLSALELVGPLIVLAAGQEWCRSRPVRVWVDNFGSVRIWKKGYSNSCGLCTTLVKAISTTAAGLGCKFTIEKITRCSDNGASMADALSKADFNKFRRTALAASWPLKLEPARIPASILAWLSNPVVDDNLGHKILTELSKSCAVLGYSC